mgnify:FL=1
MCEVFFHPLPDMGYMAGIGMFCAVSIKQDRYYKDFREQGMA